MSTLLSLRSTSVIASLLERDMVELLLRRTIDEFRRVKIRSETEGRTNNSAMVVCARLLLVGESSFWVGRV